MFATLEGTVDQALERRREARRRELRSLCEQEARIQQRVTRSCARPTTTGLARGRVLVQRAVAGADLEQRLPHRAAHHAHQRCAARPARTRPRAEHRGADARPGRSRRRVRDPRERRRARARRGRQGAQRDRAGRAHARSAGGGRRPGAVRASFVEHAWTRGKRELALSGRLPLEQGAAFEHAIWNIATEQRAIDKHAGTVLEWQQSAADALVALARQRRAATAARSGAAPPR